MSGVDGDTTLALFGSLIDGRIVGVLSAALHYTDIATDVGPTGTAILNVFNEFIIGRRDFSDATWEAAKKELDAAGYQDFLDNLNAAYSRMNG